MSYNDFESSIERGLPSRLYRFTLNDKVWRGNGKPALTEQIAVQAQTVRALCWLVAVTCAAVIAQIVAMIFKARGA